MTTKLEDETDTFESITFCQCRPVELAPGTWRMVRHPERVVNRAVHSVNVYPGKGWLRLCRAIGECEYACNTGVPILQCFAEYLIRHARGAKALKLNDYDEVRIHYEPKPWKSFEVLPSARVSFEKAFGIPIGVQYAVERYLSNADHSTFINALVNGIDPGVYVGPAYPD